MDRRKLLAAGGAAAVVAAAGPVSALADQGGEADQGLVGSWTGHVSANGNPLPAFDDLISFIDGGIVVESRRYALTPPSFPSLLETTGHGAWKRTGNRTFEAFFRFLLQETATDGPVGTDNVRLELTLDGDALTGTFHSDVKDLGGNVLVSFDGTYSAERITV